MVKHYLEPRLVIRKNPSQTIWNRSMSYTSGLYVGTKDAKATISDP